MRLTANVKRDNTDQIKAAVRAAAAAAVTETAEDVLAEINGQGLVPYEEGNLERSGQVTAIPSKLAAAITYDVPYAVRQHEDRSLRHPRQGQDHWLENTVQGNGQRYLQYIADRIRKATG